MKFRQTMLAPLLGPMIAPALATALLTIEPYQALMLWAAIPGAFAEISGLFRGWEHLWCSTPPGVALMVLPNLWVLVRGDIPAPTLVGISMLIHANLALGLLVLLGLHV